MDTLYIRSTCTCSPTRGSSFFLGKVAALGVVCCFALFVCLTLLAYFFLPSHLSFKNMYSSVNQQGIHGISLDIYGYNVRISEVHVHVFK